MTEYEFRDDLKDIHIVTGVHLKKYYKRTKFFSGMDGDYPFLHACDELKIIDLSRDAWLIDIYVHEENRRKGIGAQLLRKYEAKCKSEGCKKIVGCLSAEFGYRDKLIDWYREQGYEIVKSGDMVFASKSL